jgi:hypothetical protein
MATDILRIWGCLAPAEEAACRSMANAYRAGINRPASVIEGFFVTHIGFPGWPIRLTAWEANFRMEQFDDDPSPAKHMVYRPNRIWCQVLGDAFSAGLDQTPDPCLFRAFYNSPI